MHLRFISILAVVLVALGRWPLSAAEPAAPATTPADSAADLEFFEKRVRPLLVEHCLECHGPKKQMSGLRVDSRRALLKGGELGPAVVPGDPQASLLAQAIRHEGELKMPPETRLPATAVADVVSWIGRGAAWPADATDARSDDQAWRRHWAFQPIRAPQLPDLAPASDAERRDAEKLAAQEWAAAPLDYFVLDKLHEHRLRPAPPAERGAWLRRVTFDLIGLPPEPDEVERFLADAAPDAASRVVDRLLASPHYGERWARHWLDVARYADTKGYVIFGDKEYPWSYTYRDYVVRALNEDLPYDRFVVEQLAADVEPSPRRPASLAALGFLTVGPRFIDNQHDTIDDRIDVVTRGLMGLTVACARCHDHKYDPIPTHDYYSLYGVFASCVEPVAPPLLAEPPTTDEYKKFDEELQSRVTKLVAFLDGKHEALVQSARRRGGEYMLAVHALRDRPRQDDFMLLADGADLNPTMTLRWQAWLRETRKNGHPLFVVWHALGASDESAFSVEAPAIVARLAGHDDPLVRRIAAATQAAAIKSMADVAAVYGRLFTAVDDERRKALQETPPATTLADPLDERVRQALDSPDTPPQLSRTPFGDLELLPDRPSQGQWRELLKAIETHRAAGPHAPPRAMALVDLPQPIAPRVFLRGNPNQPGEPTPRQFLAALSGERREPFVQGSGRLELARAIVDPQNPLTARVLVNRVWQWVFGRGLVGTPSDFGLRSDPPTHPRLLDHLAGSLIADGWSIKSLQRRIVLSGVYRQASTESDSDADRSFSRQVDPENKWLHRHPRRRLDFEATRDALLSVSGALDRRLGGPPVKDTLSPGGRRRTLYGHLDRFQMPGVYRTFDFPSPDSTAPQRDVTTVSPQSLFLLNHPLAIQSAAQLARRPEIAGEPDDARRVDAIYLRLFARSPSDDERRAALEFLGGPNNPNAKSPVAWHQYVHALLLTNELVYLD